MGTYKQVIKLDPDPLAPYAISPGWQVGDVIFFSGQAAINEQGEVVGPGDFDAQLQQVFHNIDRLLHAAGSSRDQIVKVVEVRALALPDLMVEIDVIAVA